MSFEERAWKTLERIARGLNDHPPRRVVSEIKHEAMRAGVRALDRLVSKLAGRSVHTEPPRIPPRVERQAVIAAPPPAPEPIAATAPEPEHEPPPPGPPPPAPTPAPPPAPKSEPVDDHRRAEILANVARPSDASAPLPALPERFGIDRVVLLAGESEWVFAYWEIDRERLARVSRSDTPRTELRLVDEHGHLVGRALVDPHQGRQHLRIPEIGKRYRAELVSAEPGSEGVIISRSRAVIAARQGDRVATATAESLPPRPATPRSPEPEELRE